MFIQLSILKDYSTALQNRDQSGMAKRSTYGTAERQRISSQCIKAAVRKSQSLVRADGDRLIPDGLTDVAAELGVGVSRRSRHIFPTLVYPALREALGNDAAAQSWTEASAALFSKVGENAGSQSDADPDDDDVDGDGPGFMKQPVVLGQREIEAIVAAVATVHAAGIPPLTVKPKGGDKVPDLRDLLEKPALLRKAAPPVQDAVGNLLAMNGAGVGLDGALFGRMSTGSIVSGVDSCVHVAHALTVHPIVSDADFFSVQDDLAEGSAASHTNTAELTSGLFYSYVVIDLRQMVHNFASCPPEQIAGLVAWVVRAFHSVEPAAKRGSTAPYGAALHMMVEAGRRQPRSLVAAFQKAIDPRRDCRADSLEDVARRRLDDHLARLDRQMGRPEYRRTLDDMDGADAPAYEQLAADVGRYVLPAVEAMVREGGR